MISQYLSIRPGFLALTMLISQQTPTDWLKQYWGDNAAADSIHILGNCVCLMAKRHKYFMVAFHYRQDIRKITAELMLVFACNKSLFYNLGMHNGS